MSQLSAPATTTLVFAVFSVAAFFERSWPLAAAAAVAAMVRRHRWRRSKHSVGELQEGMGVEAENCQLNKQYGSRIETVIYWLVMDKAYIFALFCIRGHCGLVLSKAV
jgi:hypothetical protein